MELTTLSILAVWIEEMRPEWNVRGVDALEHNGRTVIPWFLPDGSPANYCKVAIATIQYIQKFWAGGELTSENHVEINVTNDMGLDHCKVLIENAVEQVAGR